MPKTPTKKDTKKTTASAKSTGRKVLYNTPQVSIVDITVEQAKEWLGWSEVEDAKGAHFKDEYGKHIACQNNTTNRPMLMADVKSLMSEILHGHWQLNGEAGIIGKTGLILSFQHRLVALVLASQRWAIDHERADHDAKEPKTAPTYRWPAWAKKEPFIQSVVVFGIPEEDRIVNTLDTGRPRSLWEVICRSEHFADLCPNDPEKAKAARKQCAKMLDHATRMVWGRTGAGVGADSKKRSHADSLSFIERHPTLLQAVKHVYEENEDGKVANLLSPGYMAGLLYLMGASGTPIDSEYRTATASTRTESMADLSRIDKACDWLVEVVGEKDALKPVAESIRTMQNEAYGINLAERIAILVYAWQAHVEGVKIDRATLGLEMQTYRKPDGSQAKMLCLSGSTIDTTNGCRLLVGYEHPLLGGIDLGVEADEDEVPEIAPGVADATEEEIETRKAALRKEKTQPKPKAPKLVAKRAGDEWAVGDVAYCCESDDPYLGTIDELIDCDDGSVTAMVTDADGDPWEVSYKLLKLSLEAKTQPQRKDNLPKTAPPERHNKLSDNTPKIGTLYWTQTKGQEPWRGRLVRFNQKLKQATLVVEQGFNGATTEKSASLSSLSVQQPQHEAT